MSLRVIHFPGVQYGASEECDNSKNLAFSKLFIFYKLRWDFEWGPFFLKRLQMLSENAEMLSWEIELWNRGGGRDFSGRQFCNKVDDQDGDVTMYRKAAG